MKSTFPPEITWRRHRNKSFMMPPGSDEIISSESVWAAWNTTLWVGVCTWSHTRDVTLRLSTSVLHTLCFLWSLFCFSLFPPQNNHTDIIQDGSVTFPVCVLIFFFFSPPQNHLKGRVLWWRESARRTPSSSSETHQNKRGEEGNTTRQIKRKGFRFHLRQFKCRGMLNYTLFKHCNTYPTS